MADDPLLTGALGDRARAVVAAIASAPELTSIPDDDAVDVALATGTLGIALFHAHHAAFAGRDDALDRAITLHERCTGAIGRRPLPSFLFDGWLGIAWHTEHVFRELLGQDDDLNEEIDAEALRLLEVGDEMPLELMYGLTGVGVYALARPAGSLAAERVLPGILDCLERTARTSDAGTTWFTPPTHLIGDMAKLAPRGLYNRSYAHGLGGVLGFLVRAARHPAGSTRARSLARGLASWLLATRAPAGAPFAFPMWTGDDVRPYQRNHRLAWCYGDLPLALALAQAGDVLDDGELVRRAVEVALACAAPERAAELSDIGLCHGAAGVAHMFHRLYQTTGDPALAAAARRFVAIALDEYYAPGEGVGGIRAFMVRQARERGLPGPWVPSAGLLYGAAGVGLALMSALSPSTGAWDRPFLLDLPARAA
jgi:hypothetical protein